MRKHGFDTGLDDDKDYTKSNSQIDKAQSCHSNITDNDSQDNFSGPYSIYITDTFKKHIKKFKKDHEFINYIFKKIETISKNPKIGKPLEHPLSGYWSIKIKRKYRLIYSIDKSNKRIYLLAFGHRKYIYDEVIKFLF
jgi:addiction module RelE/StbE family toxin